MSQKDDFLGDKTQATAHKGNPVDQWTLYTGGFLAYFNWYKFVDRSKVDYQKQIDDMRFMIERAFSTAYKKS